MPRLVSPLALAQLTSSSLSLCSCVSSLVLELMPDYKSRKSNLEWARLLSQLSEELDSTSNIYRGAQMLLDVISQCVCFDRSLVFRIMQPDSHVETIAEGRGMQDLYPFLGLRFPPLAPDDRHRVRDQGTTQASGVAAAGRHNLTCIRLSSSVVPSMRRAAHVWWRTHRLARRCC